MKAYKLLPLLSAVVLAGCASQTGMIKEGISTTTTKAHSLHEQVNESGLVLNDGYEINEDDGIWVSTEYVKSSSLMPKKITDKKYTFITQDSMTLSELSSFISEKTGIRITRAHELVDPTDKFENSTPQYIQHIGGRDPENESNEDERTNRRITTAKYTPSMESGTLKEFLDHIAVTMGISWKYKEDGGIHFYYYDTKTFFVHSTSSGFQATSVTENNSSSNGEGDSGGESNQSIEASIEPNFWENLTTSVEKIITENGNVVVNKAVGSVTINDNEQAINAVGDYVDDMNRLLKLQVHMRLMLVTVKVDQSDVRSLSYDLVYNGIDGTLDIDTSRITGEGLSSIGGEITNPDSDWQGSSMFLDALSRRGDVTNAITSDLLISNYRPYHYRHGGTIRYVSNVSTTNTPDVGTSESVEIDELFTGLGVVFMPNIYNKEHLAMNLMLSQQELAQFENVVLTNTTIKLPETRNQDITNTFYMRTGEMKVLAAFELEQQSTDNSGTASPDTILLGGSKLADSSKELLLLVGSPRIL